MAESVALLLPNHIVDDAVEKIRNETFSDYTYDPSGARLSHVIAES